MGELGRTLRHPALALEEGLTLANAKTRWKTQDADTWNS